ncbi:helix-turn-helix domain-containing protein [Leptolyngbyaceae cyanobacterium UHCC 1019]
MTYKPEESRKLGTALRELLKQRGLSDRQFAKGCDLGTDYISKLLNGEIDQPRQEKLNQLAKGLKLPEKSFSFDELYEEIQRLISTQRSPSPSSIPLESSGIDQVVQEVRSRLLPVITAPDSTIGTMRILVGCQLYFGG